MRRSLIETTEPVEGKALEARELVGRTRHPVRVFMMDLLASVPYYTGHLCMALEGLDGLRTDVGSITYYLDRGFFRRQGLRNNRGLLDVVAKLRFAPAALRRALKTVECLINMAVLVLRFSIARPDVIHVQFLPMVKFGFPFELWFLAAVRRLGIKVVYTVHNILPHDTGERYRTTYRRIYSLADRLICHDVRAEERLVSEFRVKPENVSIIPHGPLLEQGSTGTRDQARKRLGITPDRCLVLWQGILRPYKGVSFLLQAWPQTHGENPEAYLAIVGGGDGEVARTIREEVAARGLESSVILDSRFVSVEKLADYYLAADILVYPYSEVTTSGALMTGIGYGKAILASRLPAFEHLLTDNENALLIEYGDVAGLAGALARLIRQPELRRRLGESARQSYVNGPQWPELARQTLACYESAMAQQSV